MSTLVYPLMEKCVQCPMADSRSNLTFVVSLVLPSTLNRPTKAGVLLGLPCVMDCLVFHASFGRTSQNAALGPLARFHGLKASYATPARAYGHLTQALCSVHHDRLLGQGILTISLPLASQ